MRYYISDFDRTFDNEESLFGYLENHYCGSDIDSSVEHDVVAAEQFNEDMEPIGASEEKTVVIEPIMKWTAHDSERGEDYGCPTGSHKVYWS